MKTIDEIYAFITVEPHGEELCVFKVDDIVVPLASHKTEHVAELREIAREYVRDTGTAVKLVHFCERRLFETIEPDR